MFGCTKQTHGRKQDSAMFIDTPSSQSAMTEIKQFFPVEESLPHANIAELRKLETVGITASDKKEDDYGALENFNKTVTKENGRYQFTWLWGREDNKLPAN